MRFAQLDPKFLKIVDNQSWRCVEEIEGADGVLFLCPKCFETNSGEVGTHSIICWAPHIPLLPDLTGPGRWALKGTSVEDLSLVAGSSSVLLNGGCNAHFFVECGLVRMV